MDRGVYLAASVASGGSNYPCVLFRPTSGAPFVEVHRNATAAASGRPGFSDLHGTNEGSFMVAVGREFFKNSYGSPQANGAMSYHDGSWHDVVVPAAYRFSSCYVPAPGVAFIGGFDVGSINYARIWRWTPAGGFTLVHSKQVSTSFTVSFVKIRGTSESDIWASLGFPDNAVYNSSWHARYNGATWTDVNLPFRMVAPVQTDLVWANGVTYSATPAVYKYTGSWATVATITAHTGNVAYSVDAVADYVLIGASFISGQRLWKYDAAGGLVIKVTPGGGRRVNSIAIAAEDGIFAGLCFATTNTSAGSGLSFVESADRGETWTSEALIPGFVFGTGAYIVSGLPTPPQITPVDPTNGESGVPTDSAVSFTLTSDDNIATPWVVEIDRGGTGFELAMTYDGSAVFEPQFQGESSAVAAIANGFSVTIHPRTPFFNSQSVIVRVTAQDSYGQDAEVA